MCVSACVPCTYRCPEDRRMSESLKMELWAAVEPFNVVVGKQSQVLSKQALLTTEPASDSYYKHLNPGQGMLLVTWSSYDDIKARVSTTTCNWRPLLLCTIYFGWECGSPVAGSGCYPLNWCHSDYAVVLVVAMRFCRRLFFFILLR